MTALISLPLQGAAYMATILPRGGGVGSSLRLRGPPEPIKSPNPWRAIGALWYKIPQVIRFSASGSLATVCLYFLDEFVRWSMQTHTDIVPHQLDTMSYFLAYLLHIAAQHALHAFLVYGLETVNTRQKYFNTLIGTYQALAVSAIGSTILNSALIGMGAERNLAFVATLAIFSVLNYFWIGYVVKKSSEKAAQKERQSKKFVSMRQKAKKSRHMRGGACTAFGLDDMLYSVMTIPSEASP